MVKLSDLTENKPKELVVYPTNYSVIQADSGNDQVIIPIVFATPQHFVSALTVKYRITNRI